MVKKKAKEAKINEPMVMAKGKTKCNSAGNGACIYGIGFIGALVYYLSVATGFWVGVLGVLKAIVWPGFLVYEAFKFLGA